MSNLVASRYSPEEARAIVLAIAHDELKRYDLGHWRVVFLDKERLLGQCSTHTETIRIHLGLADNLAELRETVLHEIAHALTDLAFICGEVAQALSGGKYRLNQKGKHHDGWWQMTALLVGCTPRATARYRAARQDDTEAL